jgi:type IV secretory pathway TrbF-like protein
MAIAQSGLTPPAAVHPGGTKTANTFDETAQVMRNEVRLLQRRLTNWQRANGVLSLIALALTGVVVYLAGNIKVFPYVVEVATTGQVRTVGLLPQTWRGQTPAVIEQVVRDWLYRMRRVGTDPVIQTDQLLGANAFMSSAAIAIAKPFVQERFDLQKKEWTTQIDVGTLLPLSSDFHAVEVDWRERTFNRQGAPVTDDRWKAIINVAIYDLKELKNPREMRNPLGLFITDFSWTKTGKATP